MAQEAALKVGAPMICINDSGGARIQEGVVAGDDALAGGFLFVHAKVCAAVLDEKPCLHKAKTPRNGPVSWGQ